jgi:hypothetical protein
MMCTEYVPRTPVLFGQHNHLLKYAVLTPRFVFIVIISTIYTAFLFCLFMYRIKSFIFIDISYV